MAVGNTFYFQATDDQSCELWKSDGTTAGTLIVNSAGSHDCGWGYLKFGPFLYFASSTSSTNTGWVTDGTSAGTHALDGFSGFDSIIYNFGAQIQWLFIHGNSQYFVIKDSVVNLDGHYEVRLVKVSI